MATSGPLVTCVMPTRDQPQFARQAIEYFLRQDHPARELVVVDDGSRPISELLPSDPRIRYVRLDRQASMAVRLNIGCEAAGGRFIANWLEDDWQAADRLSVQSGKLATTRASVCASRELLAYVPTAGVARRYRGIQADQPELALGSLMYRRSAWQAHPFRDRPGIDVRDLVAELPRSQIAMTDRTDLTISVIHGASLGRVNFRDPRWESAALDDVGPLFAHDWAFYAAVREGRSVATIASRPAPLPRSLTIRALLMVADGYGSMAEYLILGLDRAGVALNVVPDRINEAGLSDRLLELVRASRPEPGAPLLHYGIVDAGGASYGRTRDRFLYTMWESDQLPATWLPALNAASAVIVPTRWCADVFRARGIKRPIVVVPDGVDPATYSYRPRADRPGITTLIVGTNYDRKHFREGIAGWKMAFEGDPDARLLLKAHHQYRPYVPDDPRITHVDVNLPTRGIADWYHQADVLLALGNEGFGLPLIEAMACGLAVVALDSEGQSDVCRDAAGLVLTVRPAGREPHVVAPYGPCGHRSVPDVGEVASRLRWVASHRDEAAQMGRAASAWVLEHRNVWDKAPRVLEVIERWLDPPRSLRPPAGRAVGSVEPVAIA